jgi:hypothetical protein
MSDPFTQSYLARHTEALLAPADEDERRIANLMQALASTADRFHGDQFMRPAIENIGSAILRLLNGPIGRLDQSSIDKSVRDTVQRAGGDSENL